VAASRLRLDRTLGPVVARWIERELVHGPGDVQGQPVELDDERVRFLCHAYRVDDAGRMVVRRVVLSRPKGWAKSEFSAMIACAEALGPVRFNGWGVDGRPEGRPVTSPIVKLFATEEGQAGDVYGAAEFMLRQGRVSRLEGLDIGMTRTFLPGGGKITANSAKANSKDGGKETFVVFDETHLYITPELKKLHETVRRNLGKRKDSTPWSLETTTMYAPGEDSIAESSHSYAKKIADRKILDKGFLFDHRQASKGFDFDNDGELLVALQEAYGAAAEWMDFERLLAEARDPMTNQSDFMRYFVNVATRREEELFIPGEAWARLTESGFEIAEGADACLGLDGSRTFDTTVVAWASADGEVIRVDARVFSVRKDAAHHVLHEGGRIDFDDVEGFTLDRFDYLHVDEAAYDPRYLDRSAELIDARLVGARIIAVEPQSKMMREALQTLERLVLEGKIRHSGDPVLAAHFANARVERGHSGEIRRVVKLDQRKPIDAVIAIALAVWRASRSPAPTAWAASW
jgi:phage terminase large subunit-like protein